MQYIQQGSIDRGVKTLLQLFHSWCQEEFYLLFPFFFHIFRFYYEGIVVVEGKLKFLRRAGGFYDSHQVVGGIAAL